MDILDNLKRFGQLYIIFALSVICFVFHSHCQLYKARLATSEAQLSTYANAITQMKIEGDKLAKRIELAQIEANKIKVDYDKQIHAILNAKVPERCESAIEWGINQANLF